MRLRPRQKTFVERSVAALACRGNTLGVAPTGAGKTIMLSAVTGEMIGDGAKACVLAHRDELTAQNRARFQRVVPGISISVIDATEKSWGGQVAFAMVPTLARASNLADMPRLDLLVIDEAHHAVADSYRRGNRALQPRMRRRHGRGQCLPLCQFRRNRRRQGATGPVRVAGGNTRRCQRKNGVRRDQQVGADIAGRMPTLHQHSAGSKRQQCPPLRQGVIKGAGRRGAKQRAGLEKSA